MYTVGITGGIGSGKSLVCQIFEVLGIPTYYSDHEAKSLMQSDLVLRKEISSVFGRKAYTPEGLNRKYLADQVFGDKQKLETLNALVHPAVRKDFKRWALVQSSPYVLNEAALHFESGGYRELDCIVSVTAPEDLRIQRVMLRDQSTENQVRQRMNNQWPQAHKDQLADYILYNDGRGKLISQVIECHQWLIKQSYT